MLRNDFDQARNPEKLGFSSTRLAIITSWYQAQIDAGALPGAVVAIARNGKLAYLEALGTQDSDTKIRMKPDAIFWIASMTKPITSVAAMMLVEEGALNLTAPVSQYLPELTNMEVAVLLPQRSELFFEPQRRPMQVVDLLRHTAGLVYGEEYGATPVHRLYSSLYGKDGVWSRDKTLADFVAALARLPLAHQPGEVWEYSHAVDVLARVVEVASGRPFDEFLKNRLFDPLGMIDTGFHVPEAELPRLVDPPAGAVGPVWHVTKPTKLFAGGGGLVSTAADYLRFCQMLLNGGQFDGVRILMTDTVRRMITNALPSDIRFMGDGIGPAAGATWGLGFAIRSDQAYSQLPGSVGSYMWSGVLGTTFWIDPAEELIALLMIQVPRGASAPYHRALRFLTYAALIDAEHEVLSPHAASLPSPSEAPAHYVGTYDFGPREGFTFTGLGLKPVGQEDGLKVIHVYYDTPAARAGVLVGDLITDIDGVPVKGLTFAQATTKLAGAAGSPVTLKLARTGTNCAIEMTIVRTVIQVPMAQLTVRLEAGRLRVEATGVAPVCEFEQGKPTALRALSNGEFLMDGGYRTRLAFEKDAAGETFEAVLNPGRWEQRASKANS